MSPSIPLGCTIVLAGAAFGFNDGPIAVQLDDLTAVEQPGEPKMIDAALAIRRYWSIVETSAALAATETRAR